jgi:hypothetical protein
MLPQQGSVKHLLITPSDGKGMTIITTGLSRGASVKDLPEGRGELELPHAEVNAPFLKAMGQMPADDQAGHPPIKVAIERHDHVMREDSVQPVPPAQRRRELGEMGVYQVVRARVRVGQWSKDVLVPFADNAAESQWEGGDLKLPDGTPMQVQLGNTRLQLPAKLTLAKFELVPYRGGDTGEGSMMRDFRSTLVVEDPKTGESATSVAHMNSPIYFGSGSWLFFQAQYDPQQRWTVLGVGNRPGVGMMLMGFLLVVVGLMYAFYLKPIIIRRMKEKALAQAAGKKKMKSADELVSV